MGILDKLFGAGGDDPRSQANMALAAGLLSGNFAGGLLGANQVFAEAPMRQKRMSLLDAQIAETLAQGKQRETQAAREQAELERQARIRSELPNLFRAPGMTGGQAVPQTFGGTDVPMFSKPAGVAPMQSTPGGFDVQRAISLGLDPKTIEAYAGLQNIGRPKATRQMEVDDGQGGKRIALVDDFGREVAGFAGYTAPVQVNRGGSIDFVKPTAGVSLPVSMSPAERDASARGWASERRQAAQAEQGKWQYDAQRGGLVNMQSGEFKPAMQNGQPIETKASREASKEDMQRRSAIENAGSVLKEVQDAKGLVGWNTAGLGGAMSVLPATEARDLAAKLQTIKANLGFDRLQQMRAESPTGGALGQVAVQELAALQATVASLDQLQSPTQLGQALDKIERHYTNWRNVMVQARSGQGGATGGWGIQKVN